MSNYEIKANIFKALSDNNRLMIVDMLSCGELCACDILEKFKITQPTLSHHMKVLCDCGLVNSKKEGKWTWYSLNKENTDELSSFLNKVFSPTNDCVCK